MPIKLKRFLFVTIYLVVCMLIILLQSSGIMTLQILTASALLVLPAVAYGGFCFGCYTGAFIGFVCGVLTDAVSSTTYFNTFALMLLGFACGVIMTYLFNRNLAAACVLCPSVSFLYFFAKWMIIYAFKDPAAGFVLLNYSLPSFVYTSVVGILIYLVFQFVFKKMTITERK